MPLRRTLISWKFKKGSLFLSQRAKKFLTFLFIHKYQTRSRDSPDFFQDSLAYLYYSLCGLKPKKSAMHGLKISHFWFLEIARYILDSYGYWVYKSVMELYNFSVYGSPPLLIKFINYWFPLQNLAYCMSSSEDMLYKNSDLKIGAIHWMILT